MSEKEEIHRLNQEIVVRMTRLRQIKQENPSLRVGFYNQFGSLLNAYREGDVGFDECVERMEKIARLNVSAEVAKLECPTVVAWYAHGADENLDQSPTEPLPCGSCIVCVAREVVKNGNN